MTAIRVDELTKYYNQLKAVDGISFEVEKGEVFGMLGPNGAGKTTTVEILEGLREADAGEAQVLGCDIRKEPQSVKQKIGVALQTATLMPNLTCTELLALFGSFYTHRLSPAVLLQKMGLEEKASDRVKTLSGGQQQRLSVALALVNDPEIVFLDEPTTGLDPQARRQLWEVVEAMRDSGKTVFLTTHYMEEAERLCNRVAIMDHGKILALDSPQGLIKSHFSERAIQFTPPDGLDSLALKSLPGALRVVHEAEDLVIYSDAVQRTLTALLDYAVSRDIELGDIRLRRATLEDVFIKLTGRRIRE